MSTCTSSPASTHGIEHGCLCFVKDTVGRDEPAGRTQTTSSSASESRSSFLLLSPSSHHLLYFVFQFVLNLISGIGEKLMDFTRICVLIG
jgi:hypothetical protein